MKCVIVCAYNRQKETTERFLDNIKKWENYTDIELILVNGGDFFRIEHKNIDKRIDIKDTGFSKVINAGLSAVPECDYVFIVGNDSFPNCDRWLDDLITLQIMTNAGIVCPSTDRPPMSAYQHLLKSDNITHWEVDMFPSIAYLIPYKAFKAIGLWDEGYIRTGMYGDDDYCRRAKNLGMTIVVSKEVLLNHLLSQEVKEVGTVNEDMQINSAYYQKKWGYK